MAAIATIGGLVTATACGLVIDPDKLIAGNGEPDDAGLPNRDVNSSDDGSGSIDGGVDAPVIPVVPACVPPAPAGTKGPYAVVFTQGAPASCPTGYLAAPVTKGQTDLDRQPAKCGTIGCSCSTITPASCTLQASWWGDPLCKDPTGDPSATVASCTDYPAKPYAFRVDVVTTSLSCQAQGSTSPTSKPAAVYNTSVAACDVDPAVAREPCDGGEVALSPITNARSCVVVSGAAKCAAPYANAYSISTTGGVTDTRGCTCTCPSGTTTCTGGIAIAYSGGGCGGGTFDAGVGICRLRSGSDSVSGTPPAPGGFVSCPAGSSPSGDVQPIDDLTLCCLP